MGTKNNSRFDNEPRIGADGKPVVIKTITPGDIEIFQLLNRYRYLPINFIAAYTGRSKKALNARLDLLHRKPHLYLNRPAQFRDQPKELSRFLDYELAENGEEILKDKGLYSHEPRLGDKELYAHSRMACEGIVNLEMGARLNGLEMIWFPEIAARLKTPHRFIPVKIAYQFEKHNETLEYQYYNDSNGPFGVRYRNNTVRFFSLEAERTTDGLAGTFRKTSFLKKFLAIRYIMDNKLYEKQWGVPNLVHLVLCPSQAKINTRKEIIMRETGGKGVSYIAFALAPTITDPDAKLVPDPDLFNRPWQRAGYPDLFLNQPTMKTVA